ncbi:membrane dipeptidase family M19 protein [Yamadazyma tenuis]|uniref:Dipeptidase n=1 Tax=Candida tenuis (strain ATCC 10573 / BCRC 21748 / CBS 615 / JCM 9827 / NBRC 10315 / NRRL Y-1498 / VKM Y-70) TaxID=590646 RepID=G3B6L0_CANTC|nr:uncharacterized protein CANTEDRAFT_123844 [Yamadazyma tenuis ATCC 10573]EGV63494.1 hypothetical protein CANTEDRAFT_123844 [Yamadazyma tenuis ATCC 10573]WEJ96682.1 membrane dipeptidase family M19 protein [Yamadazyma tenuis]
MGLFSNKNPEPKELDLDTLCKSHPIVDTHNDFPYLLRSQLHNEISNNPTFDFNHTTAHTDLTRLKKGKVGVQFFSCYIECKNPDKFYQDFNIPNSAVRDTMEQIDVTERLCKQYNLAMVHSSEDAWKRFKEGKFVVTMGVEGLHQIDMSLGVLRLYFQLGVRYITLTHNCDNPFATAASSVAGGLEDKGLTSFGAECVKEMNRLGMMVDLAHVSLKTMHDALDISRSPVMFSHSSAYALCEHGRNVPDDVLLKLKKNNGVICINFFPIFLKKEGEVTIDDAVDHMVYVINLIGWDHVGFGSDFDGIPSGPKGLEDVSKYPDFIKKVAAKTNGSNADLAKMMGGNVMRVWRDNELMAAKLKHEPACDENWDKREWAFHKFVKMFPEIFAGSMDAKQNTYSEYSV